MTADDLGEAFAEWADENEEAGDLQAMLADGPFEFVNYERGKPFTISCKRGQPCRVERSEP